MAAAIGATGKLVWRVALPATDSELQTASTPAIGATIGYWPEDGIVHALRLKDGKELWHLAQGLSNNGLWLNHGVVSVLTDDFGGGGLLTGVDAATGKAKWKVVLPGKGLTIDGPRVTGDGGLAWVRNDGVLQVIDLTTGKPRFSVREGTAAQIGVQFPQLQVVGGRVYYLAAGRMTSYDDRTGAVVWSRHGAPVHTTMSLVAGQLLLNGGVAATPFAISAVNLTDGAPLWSYDAGQTVDILGGGAGHLALVPDDPAAVHHEWVLDALSGALAWSADVQVSGQAIAFRSHDVVSVEGNGDYDRPAMLVDRRVTDGSVIWQTPVTHAAATAATLTLTFGVVVISPSGEFAHPYNPLYAYRLTNGKAAWSIGTLRPLQDAPVLLKTRMYVSAADDANLCS
jgi:outer membrane protein assembly factor BamB